MAEPTRQCAACRKRLPQRAMRRFARQQAGWVADDPRSRGRHDGRGAYLCSAACALAVAKNRRYPGLASVAAEYVSMQWFNDHD